MSTLPELTVEAFTSKHGTRCEFGRGTCNGEIAFMITPPTHEQNSRVDREDEFTSFVCGYHLAPLIALRLAGMYPVERHDGCHHSREHDEACDDERAR
jgi:hypothetical protein